MTVRQIKGFVLFSLALLILSYTVSAVELSELNALEAQIQQELDRQAKLIADDDSVSQSQLESLKADEAEFSPDVSEMIDVKLTELGVDPSSVQQKADEGIKLEDAGISASVGLPIALALVFLLLLIVGMRKGWFKKRDKIKKAEPFAAAKEAKKDIESKETIEDKKDIIKMLKLLLKKKDDAISHINDIDERLSRPETEFKKGIKDCWDNFTDVAFLKDVKAPVTQFINAAAGRLMIILEYYISLFNHLHQAHELEQRLGRFLATFQRGLDELKKSPVSQTLQDMGLESVTIDEEEKLDTDIVPVIRKNNQGTLKIFKQLEEEMKANTKEMIIYLSYQAELLKGQAIAEQFSKEYGKNGEKAFKKLLDDGSEEADKEITYLVVKAIPGNNPVETAQALKKMGVDLVDKLNKDIVVLNKLFKQDKNTHTGLLHESKEATERLIRFLESRSIAPLKPAHPIEQKPSHTFQVPVFSSRSQSLKSVTSNDLLDIEGKKTEPIKIEDADILRSSEKDEEIHRMTDKDILGSRVGSTEPPTKKILKRFSGIRFSPPTFKRLPEQSGVSRIGSSTLPPLPKPEDVHKTDKDLPDDSGVPSKGTSKVVLDASTKSQKQSSASKKPKDKEKANKRVSFV